MLFVNYCLKFLIIFRYIEAWRALDFESLLGEDSLSKDRYYERKRLGFRIKEGELRLQLRKLQSKTASSKNKRGDDFPLANLHINEQENETSTEDIESQIEKVQSEIQLIQAEYDKYDIKSHKKTSAAVTRTSGGGVHHPVDAYLLMKRLTKEWHEIEKSLLKLHNDTFSECFYFRILSVHPLRVMTC
jgi:hypothetical protein